VGLRMALVHPERIDALIVQTRSRITKGWAPFGNRDALFGRSRGHESGCAQSTVAADDATRHVGKIQMCSV